MEKKSEIEIIDETDDYVVVNKPAGILVHPTQKGESDTLADWLKERYKDIEEVGDSRERPGIVHRLDKDASGLLVVAKNQETFDLLKDQFKNRTVNKEYTVLVHGLLKTDQGTIDFDIDRGKSGRMVSRPHIDTTKVKNVGKEQNGKQARTDFVVEKIFSRHTLLKVKIHTGRTHQIRVHMLAYGHPVVGDPLYKNNKLIKKRDKELGRLFLHASKLGFKDRSDQDKEFEISLPAELQEFLDKTN